jgi:Zn-finger nucleic acid-binding protein
MPKKNPTCPKCEIKMGQELVSRSFGNPITIAEKVKIYICKRCGFELISSGEYEKIRQKLNKTWVKEAQKEAKMILL